MPAYFLHLPFSFILSSTHPSILYSLSTLTSHSFICFQFTLYTTIRYPRQTETSRNLTYVWLLPSDLFCSHPLTRSEYSVSILRLDSDLQLSVCTSRHFFVYILLPYYLGHGYSPVVLPFSLSLSPICLPLASVYVAKVVSRPACLSAFLSSSSVHPTAIDMSDDIRKIPISHPSCSLDFLTLTFWS